MPCIAEDGLPVLPVVDVMGAEPPTEPPALGSDALPGVLVIAPAGTLVAGDGEVDEELGAGGDCVDPVCAATIETDPKKAAVTNAIVEMVLFII